MVDKDPDTRVAILQRASKGLSSGGSFELLDGIISDYGNRTRVMRKARDLVNTSSIVPSQSCRPFMGHQLGPGS